jgi:hypothetical protein
LRRGCLERLAMVRSLRKIQLRQLRVRKLVNPEATAERPTASVRFGLRRWLSTWTREVSVEMLLGLLELAAAGIRLLFGGGLIDRTNAVRSVC